MSKVNEFWKRVKQEKCDSCGKRTDVSSGWHLKNGLNFCSNLCVANFLEKLTQ